MNVKEWKKEALEIMETEYGLENCMFEEVTLLRSFDSGDTPRDFANWQESKHNLINFNEG